MRQRTGKAFMTVVSAVSNSEKKGAEFPKSTYRDSDSNTNEKHIYAEFDRLKIGFIVESIVDTPGQTATSTKRQGQTGKSHRGGNTPVADKETNVGFKTDEEEV